MGLLEKASAFARAKSLLHRSLELLIEEPTAVRGAPLAAERNEPAPVAESAVFDVPVFSIRVENPEPAATEEPPKAQLPAAPSAPPPVADPAAFSAELASSVSSLEPTIDLPARLFGLLKDRLGITKGALLLYDSVRQVFAPWAAAGYDAATLRRLRIPLEGTVLARLAGSPPMEISEAKAVADLRRFFSSRESGSLERLLLAPLTAADRLAGVLIATEIAPPVPAGAPLVSCLARAATAALPALQRLRDVILHSERPSPASPREAREELTRFLAAHPRGTPPLTVFPLSLERCRTRVIASNPWLDPFRLEEDLRSVVSTFSADIGRAVHLGRLRFLVAVRDLAASDTDLFVHQLASLLASLFHATGFEPADAEVGSARLFPEAGEATPEAAAELLAQLAAS
jgi:hypothetical protein